MFGNLKALAGGGILLGILFAPQKGTKTRKKLAKIFVNYKDEVVDYVKDTANKVDSNIDLARHSFASEIDS